MSVYIDEVFAALDRDGGLERIAGGNETEVYRTDDGRFVVKVKGDLMLTSPEAALAWAKGMRAAAEQFVVCLGPRYTIPSEYVIARDSKGEVQIVVVQPFVADARPLFDLDYGRLDRERRDAIAHQLNDVIRRSLAFYRTTGSMPDLYGRSSTSSEERRRLNGPLMLPWRLWSFLVKRNLLRAHNLMWSETPCWWTTMWCAGAASTSSSTTPCAGCSSGATTP
jgi:hypothetical protein